MAGNDTIRIESKSTPEAAAHEALLKSLVYNGKVMIPIDVDEVARRLNVGVRRIPLDQGIDGLLVKDKPGCGFTAFIDAYAGPHRARFTLAHELGHFVKDYQDFPIDDVAGLVQRRDEMSSRGTDRDEIWANKFAAALLMPTNVVARLWADNLSVSEIARKLNVSVESLRHRLEGLRLS